MCSRGSSTACPAATEQHSSLALFCGSHILEISPGIVPGEGMGRQLCHLGFGWSMQLGFGTTQKLSVSSEKQNRSLNHTFRLLALTATADFFEYQSQRMFGKLWNPLSPSSCLLSMLSITHMLQRFCAVNRRAVLYSSRRSRHHSPQKYQLTTSTRKFSLVIEVKRWDLTSSTYLAIGWFHTQSWSVLFKFYFSYPKGKIPHCTF